MSQQNMIQSPISKHWKVEAGASDECLIKQWLQLAGDISSGQRLAPADYY